MSNPVPGRPPADVEQLDVHQATGRSELKEGWPLVSALQERLVDGLAVLAAAAIVNDDVDPLRAQVAGQPDEELRLNIRGHDQRRLGLPARFMPPKKIEAS